MRDLLSPPDENRFRKLCPVLVDAVQGIRIALDEIESTVEGPVAELEFFADLTAIASNLESQAAVFESRLVAHDLAALKFGRAAA
jgi:hypothetical protein